jgi:hypothetical protein
MVANPKGATLAFQATVKPNLPPPASASAAQAPPRPKTPAPQSAPPSPAMMNKLNALIKSVSIDLTVTQNTTLGNNTRTMNVGLFHMKQLQEMLSADGADTAKFTCAPDFQTHWGFKIQRIAPSDASFHQKVMTQDEKAETYVGFMSIFNNNKIAGNPELDDITMDELTSALINLENKIKLGDYITGSDLRLIVSLLVEDLSSPPLAQPSKPADFAHIDLKEMKALKNLLKTAKSPDQVVIV